MSAGHTGLRETFKDAVSSSDSMLTFHPDSFPLLKYLNPDEEAPPTRCSRRQMLTFNFNHALRSHRNHALRTEKNNTAQLFKTADFSQRGPDTNICILATSNETN